MRIHAPCRDANNPDVPSRFGRCARSPGGFPRPRLQPAPRALSGSLRHLTLRLIRTPRSEEHTSELQSLMRISYAVFCLKKNTYTTRTQHMHTEKISTLDESTPV